MFFSGLSISSLNNCSHLAETKLNHVHDTEKSDQEIPHSVRGAEDKNRGTGTCIELNIETIILNSRFVLWVIDVDLIRRFLKISGPSPSIEVSGESPIVLYHIEQSKIRSLFFLEILS
jgi:hypothetical protein